MTRLEPICKQSPRTRPALPAPSVLLVDDHAVFRHGLKAIVQQEFAGATLAEAGDAAQALQLARTRQWDAVLLDISMPGRSGLEILQELKQTHAAVSILVLSMHPDEHYAIRVLRAGASGYINKVKAPREIIEALKQVLVGEMYVSPSLNKRLLEQLVHGWQKWPHEGLTDREFEIMRMIASGKAGKEIAADLGISIQTVSTHRGNVFRKLELDSMAQLIRYAIQHQLVD